MVSVLFGGVSISQVMPCVPALADGPFGGFRKGFYGGCPASFSFARCLALEGLSARQVVTITWDPRSPRVSVRGSFSGRRGLLESLTLVAVRENGGDSGMSRWFSLWALDLMEV
ncbi:hypothetical protein Taro_053435 [Colocasia esculenta]|uniref:Uncharacterized protein n=1 Tax=Colocasia esculenta TaxID=4460 RepID=A0A843XM62_COLES|nr:hypothetical protein [Colocasia esculenta]